METIRKKKRIAKRLGRFIAWLNKRSIRSIYNDEVVHADRTALIRYENEISEATRKLLDTWF